MNSWAEYTLPLMRRLTDLMAEGDADRFAEQFHEGAATWRGRWKGNAALPLLMFRDVDPAVVEAVRRALLERLPEAARRPELEGCSLLQAMVAYPLLTSGLDPRAEAREILDDAEHRWNHVYNLDLAAALLLTRRPDEPVAPNLVAALRRDPPIREWFEMAGLPTELTDPPLNPGEGWADRLLEFLGSAPADWHEFLAHLGTATGSTPPRRWSDQTRTHVETLGTEAVRDRLLSWLGLVGEPRNVFIHPREHYGTNYNDQFDPCNIGHLRGLVWTIGLLPPDGDSIRSLARLVAVSQRKIPGVGVRSQAITNAAIQALSMIDDPGAVGQIARLAATVKAKPTLKTLGKVLDARAAALGIGRDEVEELSVPDYGLTRAGGADGRLGETLWEIAVEPDGTKLLWRDASGKVLKSPPAEVRREHAETVRELKATVKDIATMVTAQSDRLDRQFLADRKWLFTDWWDRYAGHPLVATVARRLIWVIDDVACCFADGELRTVDGAEFSARCGWSTVTLWHPIGRDLDEVFAWREFLERHGVVQPFKQAHREVYLLTAAEENTRVYSNRFAAHILRQHQFNMLARTRGWNSGLLMSVHDEHDCAVKQLPAWDLQAEYWFTGVDGAGGEALTESGAYLRVSTDRVRFRTGPMAEPTPLAEVPPLVLSEVLRDVDLFVGVSSVGNDPEWSDGGPEGRYRDYWHSYSFGELGATAVTRRDVLERLIPRLAIADRVEIEGRFLRVRGDLRTYKIHLGSGNILMEPGDVYLCIVPKRAAPVAADQVHLPFDGDRVLSLILSKALLLAKDAKITDPTITSQIRRS